MAAGAVLLTLPLVWLTLADRIGGAVRVTGPTAEIAWRDDGSLFLDVARGSGLPRDVRFSRVGSPSSRAANRQAAISIGADTHVSVVPPFVVLTRSHESITVERLAGRLQTDGPLPAWVRRDDVARLVVELTGELHAVIDSRGLRLHRGAPPGQRI